jgi:diguanylate cyclase (GGDEF)-like protein
MEINCLSPEELSPILDRKRNPGVSKYIPNIPLKALLINILEKANDFVPSEAGSILLDDPLQKRGASDLQELVFVCCFGPTAGRIVGDRIPADSGIAGNVYRTGVSIMTNNSYECPDFSDRYDRKLGYRTQSVLCVAIRIGNSICGVIELLNKQGRQDYENSEKGLLEIFAQYISSTIQNAIDAKKIEKMVRMDDLTGLANDRYLHERLPVEVEHHVATQTPLSIIFLDLDGFKSINDTYGHMAGSNTLAEYGHLLAKVVRAPGATLARYGGDEFVVVLPGTTPEQAAAVAEDIRRATEAHVFLAAPWANGEAPLNLGDIITASIGISTLHPPPAVEPDQRIHVGIRLLQTADKAMYDSKDGGKNRASARAFAI